LPQGPMGNTGTNSRSILDQWISHPLALNSCQPLCCKQYA
jgi:hypothetical protein